MCARYTMRVPAEQVRTLFEVEEVPELEPRYNVAPTQEMPVVIENREHEREVRVMRWGLVPYWAKDISIGHRMINAKSETLFEKPAFSHAATKRRCLIPADGFYEWLDVEETEPTLFGDETPKKGKTKKQPFHITLKSHEPFAMAGLYEYWEDPQTGKRLQSYSVITCEANALVAKLHDRMPVIVRQEDYDRWLARDIQSEEEVKDVLKPLPAELMEARAVNPAVGNPVYDSEELLQDAKP